jgi:hypothetical protein
METTDMTLHVDFEQRIPHGLEAPGQKGNYSPPRTQTSEETGRSAVIEFPTVPLA